MKRQHIDPKTASVAATFYEPVYQRLRDRHNGQPIDLLCFVGQTPDNVRRVLAECGATESKVFQARCFSEVWEVPHADLVQGPIIRQAAELDQRIVEALGCQSGRFSSAPGRLLWSDRHEASHRRQQIPSNLLQECLRNRGRHL